MFLVGVQDRGDCEEVGQFAAGFRLPWQLDLHFAAEGLLSERVSASRVISLFPASSFARQFLFTTFPLTDSIADHRHGQASPFDQESQPRFTPRQRQGASREAAQVAHLKGVISSPWAWFPECQPGGETDSSPVWITQVVVLLGRVFAP